VHDLGKAATPHAEWPGHKGHEERSVTLIESLCDRLKLSSEYRELSIIVRAITATCIVRLNCGPTRFWEFWKRPTRFAGRCDLRRRSWLARPIRAAVSGLENTPYPQRNICRPRAMRPRDVKPTPEDIRGSGGTADCGAHTPAAAQGHQPS